MLGEMTHLNYHMKSSKGGSNFSLLFCMQLFSWCVEPQIVLNWKHIWRRFCKGHPAMDRPCSSFVSFGPTTPSLDLHPSATDNECLGQLKSTSRLSLTTTEAIFQSQLSTQNLKLPPSLFHFLSCTAVHFEANWDWWEPVEYFSVHPLWWSCLLLAAVPRGAEEILFQPGTL